MKEKTKKKGKGAFKAVSLAMGLLLAVSAAGTPYLPGRIPSPAIWERRQEVSVEQTERIIMNRIISELKIFWQRKRISVYR